MNYSFHFEIIWYWFLFAILIMLSLVEVMTNLIPIVDSLTQVNRVSVGLLGDVLHIILMIGSMLGVILASLINNINTHSTQLLNEKKHCNKVLFFMKLSFIDSIQSFIFWKILQGMVDVSRYHFYCWNRKKLKFFGWKIHESSFY